MTQCMSGASRLQLLWWCATQVRNSNQVRMSFKAGCCTGHPCSKAQSSTLSSLLHRAVVQVNSDHGQGASWHLSHCRISSRPDLTPALHVVSPHGQGGLWLLSHCRISSCCYACILIPGTGRILAPEPLQDLQMTGAAAMHVTLVQGHGWCWLLSHCRTAR